MKKTSNSMIKSSPRTTKTAAPKSGKPTLATHTTIHQKHNKGVTMPKANC